MAAHGGRSGGGYQVMGFSKGLRLIELLCAARQPLGVSELSQQLGLNKPMVLRLLRTLLTAGWVVKINPAWLEKAAYQKSERPTKS